ncbi:HNH endonuclease domain-containing protein [Mycolicibacterium cosmeticum]|uniref:HNH endonuclease domain-containing protein n=1 Tax=Mycolicibacterium cosmeticum TaxID=258533 RepID=W9AK97_MYCCO|nr:HNH endonuclease domain-containing protein [Mycolicibacterium cosmeticum]
MSTAAASLEPKERLAVLFGEIGELCGQRNAIDGRLVEIVAEIAHEDLAGMTGCRSIAALVAWKTGVTPRNAETMTAVAHPPSTAPPNVAPYKGPAGERAQWWWYQPFQPPPTSEN